MKLNRPVKIIIGLTTAWVVLYPFLFLAVWFSMFFGITFASSSVREGFPFWGVPFSVIFLLHCLTILLGFFLDAFYLIHTIKNLAGSETIRIILALGIFLIPFIAMPLYYGLYIWLDQPPMWAMQSGQKSTSDTKRIVIGLLTLFGLVIVCFFCFFVFATNILAPTIMNAPSVVSRTVSMTCSSTQPPNELGQSVVYQDMKTTVIEYQFGGAYIDENGYERKPHEKEKFLWLHISAENVGQVTAEATSGNDFQPIYKGTKVAGGTYIYYRPGYSDYQRDRISPGTRTDGWLLFYVPEAANPEDTLICFNVGTPFKPIEFSWQLR